MVTVTTILASIALYSGVSMASLAPFELDSLLSLPSPINSGSSNLDSWHLSGSAVVDSKEYKLSLTSLTEGNQRGAIWSQDPISYKSFKFSVSLGVSGPVNPGGGLAIWYSKNPGETGPVHGSRDKWDGLGIMIDYDGGKEEGKGEGEGEGMIRGHLNDGTISYNDIATTDDIAKQAFARCKIGYRNTGTPFVIDLIHEPGQLNVKVNGQNCFNSDKIELEPFGYFGISAESTDKPDNFNIYSMLVSHGSDKIEQGEERVHQRSTQTAKSIPKAVTNERDIKHDYISQQALDKMATSDHISDILTSMERLSTNMEYQLKSLSDEIREVKAVKNILNTVNERISKLEKDISKLDTNYQSSTAQTHADQRQQLSEATNKLQNKIEEIHKYFESSSNNLLNALPASVSQSIIKDGPSIWRAIILLFIIQGAGFISYIIYKNKRETRHEKWL